MGIRNTAWNLRVLFTVARNHLITYPIRRSSSLIDVALHSIGSSLCVTLTWNSDETTMTAGAEKKKHSPIVNSSRYGLIERTTDKRESRRRATSLLTQSDPGEIGFSILVLLLIRYRMPLVLISHSILSLYSIDNVKGEFVGTKNSQPRYKSYAMMRIRIYFAHLFMTTNALRSIGRGRDEGSDLYIYV